MVSSVAALSPFVDVHWRYFFIVAFVNLSAVILAFINHDIVWMAPGIGALYVIFWVLVLYSERVYSIVFPHLHVREGGRNLARKKKGWQRLLLFPMGKPAWAINGWDLRGGPPETMAIFSSSSDTPSVTDSSYFMRKAFRPFVRGPRVLSAATLSYFCVMLMVPLKRYLDTHHAQWSDEVAPGDCGVGAPLVLTCDLLTVHILASAFWSMFCGFIVLAGCTMFVPSVQSLEDHRNEQTLFAKGDKKASKYRDWVLEHAYQKEVGVTGSALRTL